MAAEYRSLSGPKRLGDRLLEAGLITRTQLDLALEQQQQSDEPRSRLGGTLVELGFVTERDLLQMLSVHLGMPLASLSPVAPQEHTVVRPESAAQNVGPDTTVPGESPPTTRLRGLVRSLLELADSQDRLSTVLASAEEESRRLAAELLRIRAELARVREDNDALREPLLDAVRQLFPEDHVTAPATSPLRRAG